MKILKAKSQFQNRMMTPDVIRMINTYRCYGVKMKRVLFILKGVCIFSFAFLCFLAPNLYISKLKAQENMKNDRDTIEAPISKGIDDKIVKNSTYDLGSIAGKIKLTNGIYDGALNDHAEIKKIVFGDLNNDDKEDAVVIIEYSGGGSGLWPILLAVVNNGDKLGFPQGIDLGDRNNIESVKIKKGVIILNMVVHKKNDPACCPSKRSVEKFVIEKNILISQNENTAGIASPKSEDIDFAKDRITKYLAYRCSAGTTGSYNAKIEISDVDNNEVFDVSITTVKICNPEVAMDRILVWTGRAVLLFLKEDKPKWTVDKIYLIMDEKPHAAKFAAIGHEYVMKVSDLLKSCEKIDPHSEHGGIDECVVRSWSLMDYAK